MATFLLDQIVGSDHNPPGHIHSAMLRVHAVFLKTSGANVPQILQDAYSAVAQYCLSCGIILSERLLNEEIPRVVLGYALTHGWIPLDSTKVKGVGPFGVPAVCEALMQKFEQVFDPPTAYWAAEAMDALHNQEFLKNANDVGLQEIGLTLPQIAQFKAAGSEHDVVQGPDPVLAATRTQWFNEQCQLRHDCDSHQKNLTISGIANAYGGPDPKTMQRYLHGDRVNLKQFKRKLELALREYDNALSSKPKPVTVEQIPD